MKQKEIAFYIFWGIVTTVINIVVFYILLEFIGISYLCSNAVAWIISITAAFFINKYFVFLQENVPKGRTIFEYFKFVASRLVTGALDMGLMFLLVTIMVFNEMFSKVLVSIFVIISNYILSKYVVFKNC